MHASSNLATAAPTLMARLKNDTSTAHKQLEKTHCLARLFTPDYSMNEYLQLLHYFYGYFRSIEPLIFDDLPAELMPALQHRQKTILLYHDLQNANSTVHDLSNIPNCQQLPNLSSLAERMGALYVLEGSTLGGRVIAKHLSAHFGEQVLPHLHFYSAYGEAVMQEWQNFTQLMNNFATQHPSQEDTIIASANATFNSLQHWLQQQTA